MEEAEQKKDSETAKSIKSLTALIVLIVFLALVFYVPIRTCSTCLGASKIGLACITCESTGKQTIWQIFRGRR